MIPQNVRPADALASEMEMNNHEPSLHPAPNRRHIYIVACVVFIILGLIAFSYLAQAVVLPVVFACVASMALNPPVRWLREHHLPSPLAAAIVLCVFVTIVAFGALRLGQPAIEWFNSAPENLPQLREKLQRIFRPIARLTDAASSVGSISPAEDPAKKAQPVEVKDNHAVTVVFTRTGSLLAGVGETIALVFLLLASGDLFLHKFVHVMPTLHNKKQAVEISHKIQRNISRYLFSVTLINLVFGMLVGLALYFLGMPNAVMWGGVVTFANFIPYFGPFLGMTAVAVAGLLAFDTIASGLLPAGAYLVLHLIEANFVTPFILGRRFTMNPVIIFIALIFFTWLWGIAGALLAVPLLVTLKVVCDDVPALYSLGELLSGQRQPQNEK
jgi:predicted PurR-regulated permease PerM